MKSFVKAALIVFTLSVFFTGCGGVKTVQPEAAIAPPALAPPALRVGVTPDYPPLIFKTGEDYQGLEADLARKLAKALNRKVRFVEWEWEDQINALLAGRIDIIMSGMTATAARKIRITFTEPYLKTGLTALMRADNIDKFNSALAFREGIWTVGVVRGTTGEVFVHDNFRKAGTILAVQDPAEGIYCLNTRRIDLFVYDAPAVAWLASENEGRLRVFPELLNEEYIAWGIGKENISLLDQVNTVLRGWKKEGTLREVINRWLPEWKHFE